MSVFGGYGCADRFNRNHGRVSVVIAFFRSCARRWPALAAGLLLFFAPGQSVFADPGLATETRTDQAVAKYGVTGRGVIVAIIDRGIDYAHPDFRLADGATRIKYMWDQSAENLCTSGSPVAYSEAQINAALNGKPLAERDAVGHGTVTAAIAAGNGRAYGRAQYAGMAPEADLLIVKGVSEGAPAHGSQAAEAPFQGCYNEALDLVTKKAASLHKPIVALINSGTQWGPIDGSSAVSRRIDLDFGLTQAGRVYVSASGDEGDLSNHAGGSYVKAYSKVFHLSRASAATSYMSMWYSGSLPAKISMTFVDDGITVGPVLPGQSVSKDGISITQYDPGQQFYPWQSSGPDRAVWIQIVGHQSAGTLAIQGLESGTGRVDVYGDAGPNVTFATNQLALGRLTDYSSTRSAIVTGCYNLRTTWTDIDGVTRSITDQGGTHALWLYSSGGPTRDGRVPPDGGVDLTTPGGNVFAAYAQNSYWETFRFNLVQDGGGWYGRQSATSGASPITVGAVALLLQMKPTLTGSEIRRILDATARADSFTKTVPNQAWGAGKVDVLAAADMLAGMIRANPLTSTSRLDFSAQQVGTASVVKRVMLANTGSQSLNITNVAVSGEFRLSQRSTCGATLGPGEKCAMAIAFVPRAHGTKRGMLTIKDINVSSPQRVLLRGTSL